MKERDYNIDVVAGIMILNMVIYHYSPIEVQKYLGFFIPWFFYKGGLYYHVSTTREAVGKCKKLVVSFFLFSFLGYIEHSAKIFVGGDSDIVHYTLTPIKELLTGGAIEGNLPLWFLTSLIVSRIVYNYLIQ